MAQSAKLSRKKILFFVICDLLVYDDGWVSDARCGNPRITTGDDVKWISNRHCPQGRGEALYRFTMQLVRLHQKVILTSFYIELPDIVNKANCRTFRVLGN
jgi:hypothetical protein